MDLHQHNIPILSIGEIEELLCYALGQQLERGAPLSEFPSVMLWGPPGVGKSKAVRGLADKLAARYGKRCAVTDVRLLLFTPVDLRGIPTANADKTLAIWLKPKIFELEEGEDVINLLFLDEISAAPPSVQAAAYQIALDHTVGEHRLPDNCVVIAAGNRVTDKSVAYKMPKALANRLTHLEAAHSFDSWHAWAVQRGIHPLITGFLAFRRDRLMAFDPADEDLAFATPRSWEQASRLLQLSDDPARVMPLVAGTVGSGIAKELETWSRVYADLPDIPGIFAGRGAPLPKGSDALYALCASMTAYAGEHKEDLEGIVRSIGYADRMPPDFSAMLLRSYLYLEDGFKEKLMKNGAFLRWLQSKGRMLNGLL